jgi:hypothetical protein
VAGECFHATQPTLILARRRSRIDEHAILTVAIHL